jgi:hypothetical protein
MYTSVKTSRSATSPIFLLVDGYSSNTLMSTGGTCILGVFGGEEGTGGSGLAAGVGVGDGHPGSTAREGRSLTVDQPCESPIPPGSEARSYACRRRVAAGGATRYGSGGPHDRPPLEKTGQEGFRINIFAPSIFCGAATRPACSTNPSSNRYRVTYKLS